MLRPLLIALQFLTRLPLSQGLLRQEDYSPAQLGRSVVMYPVVGLVIGALLVGLMLLLTRFIPALSSLVLAAILLMCWVLLTGALHLDGLSDSADAWVGGYGDKDRTMAIMKDPYCGPAGVTIIVIVLLLKFALLGAVSPTDWSLLLLSPVIARATIPLLFMTTRYVRRDGIGATHADHMPHAMAWLMIALVMAGCACLLQMKALWLLPAVVVLFLLLRYLMVKRIGGTTGDTAGALIEIIEGVVLLGLVI